ncbi:MAG: hypothetical protein GY856_10445 [bacterium]|nr:hypothetical protein [bacterium]
MEHERRLDLAALAIGLAFWGGHRLYFGDPGFPVDDAYITLHNAQSLVHGGDPHFPGIPALAGATSVVHTVLIAGLLPFVTSPEKASYVVAGLAVCLFAVGMVRLLRALGVAPGGALAAAALGLTISKMPHQLFNGLETGLALAGLTWAMALSLSPPSPWRRRLLPLVCAQLPFIRPELIVPSALLLVLQAWETAGDRPRWIPDVARQLGLAAAGAAPWLLVNFASFGDVVPSTIDAKRLFFAEGCLNSLTKIQFCSTALGTFLGGLGFMCVGFGVLYRSWTGRVGLIFFAVFMAVYYAEFPGALIHYENRYLYVFVPFALCGIGSLLGKGAGRRSVMAGVVVLALIGLQLVFTLPETLDWHRRTRFFTWNEGNGTASVLADLPQDSVVLVHDIGYVSFVSQLRLVDLVGLKTPENVALHRRLTYPHCGGAGREEAIGTIARETRPTHAIVLAGWDRIYRITDALRRAGWTLTTLRDPRPHPGYYVYQLTPPGG